MGIFPIWFTGSAVMDASLTTNDLKALDVRVATNLVACLSKVLADRGYEVIQASPVVAGDEDFEVFDAHTRQLFAELRTNFVDLSEQIYLNRPNLKNKRSDFKMETSVAELRDKVGLREADLLVLLDSKAFFESPNAHHERSKWNRTGGAALMPLVIALGAFGQPAKLPLESSPCWMEHTILIADARTLEAVFWNGRRFPGEDARNTNALRAKLKDTLAGFEKQLRTTFPRTPQ